MIAIAVTDTTYRVRSSMDSISVALDIQARLEEWGYSKWLG